jgi:hypothetical protein
MGLKHAVQHFIFRFPSTDLVLILERGPPEGRIIHLVVRYLKLILLVYVIHSCYISGRLKEQWVLNLPPVWWQSFEGSGKFLRFPSYWAMQ